MNTNVFFCINTIFKDSLWKTQQIFDFFGGSFVLAVRLSMYIEMPFKILSIYWEFSIYLMAQWVRCCISFLATLISGNKNDGMYNTDKMACVSLCKLKA